MITLDTSVEEMNRIGLLSVRAKNVCRNGGIRTLRNILNIDKYEFLNLRNCGVKTLGEIEVIREKYAALIAETAVEEEVGHTDLYETKNKYVHLQQSITASEMLENNESEKEIADIGLTYPFLLTKECEKIADFHKQHEGQFPYLYVAKLYILRSDNPRVSIYRDYYGLNSSSTCHTFSEIGESHNLTRERVRQIINGSMPLSKTLQEGVRQYLSPLINNVVAFDSLLWGKIQRDNMLEESYTQTAMLAGALLDTYRILQIDVKDKKYLVRKSITENVKVRNVLNSICRDIELRCATIRQLDILQYIKSDRRTYHKDVGQLCAIYASFLKRKYHVEIQNNHIVIVLPNVLDIPSAIENILEQKGKPMSLDDLLNAFNQLHPANAIENPIKFKSYIYKNKNIKAKGKTGIYVLKKWRNYFTGTLTSYLEYILRSFNEPIALEDLVDFAIEEFPNTNKKSIYSLIAMDNNTRFITYEGDYIGLSDNYAIDDGLKRRKIKKRLSFGTRFGDFKEFVRTMKRMPNMLGLEEEQSLARWMVNVLKSNIDLTKEQLSSFREFINDNNKLPQNGIEYNFKQMCDQIKVIVNHTFALPNVIEHQSESQWLRRNLEKYKSYEDNRRTYFEDLLSYLKDFGFYF